MSRNASGSDLEWNHDGFRSSRILIDLDLEPNHVPTWNQKVVSGSGINVKEMTRFRIEIQNSFYLSPCLLTLKTIILFTFTLPFKLLKTIFAHASLFPSILFLTPHLLHCEKQNLGLSNAYVHYIQFRFHNHTCPL